MNNKQNKLNLTLTVFGLLGACGVADAQQVKQDVKPVAPAAVAPVAPAAPVVPVAVKPVAPAVAVAPVAPVAPTPPVAVKPVAPAAAVAPTQPVAVTPVAPVAPVAVKPAEAEAKPAKKEEKMLATKSFNERLQLVDKYGKGKGLVIGLFPGFVSNIDTVSYMYRFLPFTNYLTVSANELVSFVPETNAESLKAKVADHHYDLVYANATVAMLAVKNGYEPIAQRSDKLISTILVKKTSPVVKAQDLANLKVGGISGGLTTVLAQAKFKRDNIGAKVISSGLVYQKDLILGLDGNNFDAVIIRKENADELVAKQPDKYRIAFVADEGPGYILLAKKELPYSVKEGLTKGLVALDVTNTTDQGILAGLDTKSSGFIRIDSKEIESLENKIKIVE